jgi:hypothetical protein
MGVGVAFSRVKGAQSPPVHHYVFVLSAKPEQTARCTGAMRRCLRLPGFKISLSRNRRTLA